MKAGFWVLWSVVWLGISGMAAIADPAGEAPVARATIDMGKKATALVETEEASGSAFCVDAAGLFLTNEHVVSDLKPGEPLTLVLNSGETDQKKMTATVVRVDQEEDLALLRVPDGAGLTALKLGSADQLLETMRVLAFGFPFGTGLALQPGDYPNATVSTARITALRKTKGDLAQIQLDGSINPGNSGGPLLNDQGQVIGIVAAQIAGAEGINFAIPVNTISRFLNQLTITLDPAAIPRGKETQPQAFVIKAGPLKDTTAPVSVELVLGSGDSERSFTAQLGEAGLYRVTAPPLPTPAGPAELELIAMDGGSAVVYHVADKQVGVNRKWVALSSLRRIEGGATPMVTFKDGTTQAIGVYGMDAIPATIAGAPVTLNLARFQTVLIQDSHPPASSVEYTIEVKQAGHSLGETKGALAIGGGQAAPPHYVLTDLGTFGGTKSQAYAVNERGQVVGSAALADNRTTHAFLWENGRMVDLGAPQGIPFSEARGINSKGQIVGYSKEAGDIKHAFLWENGKMSLLGAGAAVSTTAYAINELGQIAGQVGTHAALWMDPGHPRDLGAIENSAWASGINRRGQVVGITGVDEGVSHGFLWEDGEMEDLGTLGGDLSGAGTINNKGHIAGSAWIPGDPHAGIAHPFLVDGKYMNDLGTLGGVLGVANGLNNLDQVVGWSWKPGSGNEYAFLWQGDKMYSLNEMVTNPGGWRLEEALAISDSGQIVGWGQLAGNTRAFLLTPLVEQVGN